MRRICLLDWDGTLHKGITTFEFVRFCATQLPDLIQEENKIEKILAHRSDYDYDLLVKKIADVFLTAIKRLDASTLSALEDEFVRSRLNLYDYTEYLLRRLNHLDFEPYIISGAPETIVRKAMHKYVSEPNIFGIRYVFSHNRIFNITGQNLGTFSGKEEAVGAILSDGKQADLAIGDAPADSALFFRGRVSVLLSEPGKEKIYGYSGKQPSFVVSKDLFLKFIDSVLVQAKDAADEYQKISITGSSATSSNEFAS